MPGIIPALIPRLDCCVSMKTISLNIRRSAMGLPLVCALAALFPVRASAANSVAREWNEQLLGAIRLAIPNPPAHARNLFHTATVMYNAWAAYDATAVGYIYNEKVATPPGDLLAARNEAISYAAYRLLRTRFASGTGWEAARANFDAELTALGYSTAVGQAPATNAATPAELGKRIADAIITWSAADGFNNTAYPQPYDSTVNPNVLVPLSVLGMNGNFTPNMQLGFGIPAATNPNFWQPLDLSSSITQNGIPIPGGQQPFLGVQSLATTPFSLKRTDPVKPWLDPFGGPSRLSTPGYPSASDAAYKEAALSVLRASSQLNDQTEIDISPASIGNSPLGTDSGTGFSTNPVTNTPYTPSLAKRGDFFRVLAEFWADGPNSETPPGHWHVIANQVADHPLFEKKLRGTGPVLDSLEWDVKMYFALSAATHDAACAAWALKRYYSGTRPITMIRYMGSKGQSSISGLAYNSQGLLLEPGVCEVITATTAATGGKHETIWDVRYNFAYPGSWYIGQVAVYSWPGEHPSNAPAPAIAGTQNPVRWMLAKDWLPFQRKTFNTPAFPGYISGHSTFSRAAAEALTLLTGTHLFPGGFHHHTVAANSLQIDKGPSAPVDLQWCSYYDAADQAGKSRIYGGIHPPEDDYHGRIVGSQAGTSAYTLAEKYWTGTIAEEVTIPEITLAGTTIQLTWNALRGMYYKVQASNDLTAGSWTDASSSTIAYDTRGTWTDSSPAPGRKFYRILRTAAP